MRLLNQLFIYSFCIFALAGCVEDTVYYNDGPQSQTYYTNTPVRDSGYSSSQTRNVSHHYNNGGYSRGGYSNRGYSSSQTREVPPSDGYYSR